MFEVLCQHFSIQQSGHHVFQSSHGDSGVDSNPEGFSGILSRDAEYSAFEVMPSGTSGCCCGSVGREVPV